jgi:hypothetical protein
MNAWTVIAIVPTEMRYDDAAGGVREMLAAGGRWGCAGGGR